MLDGAGYHKEAALELPDNITLLLLPAYSPELNPAENIWVIRRTTSGNVTGFAPRSRVAWRTHLDDPELSVESIAAACSVREERASRIRHGADPAAAETEVTVARTAERVQILRMFAKKGASPHDIEAP